MVDDRQTQTLPPTGPNSMPSPLRRLRVDGSVLHRAATPPRQRRGHYADLFEEAPALGGPGNLVFTAPTTIRRPSPPSAASASPTAPRSPRSSAAGITAATAHAQHARPRAADGDHAEAAGVAGAHHHPDIAFARFDDFLGHLPAGVQLFSLLYANPGLLDLIAEIMAARRAWRSSEPARHLLEAVLARGFFDPLPPRRSWARVVGVAAPGQRLPGCAGHRAALDQGPPVPGRRARAAPRRRSRKRRRPLADIADTAIAALQPSVEQGSRVSTGGCPATASPRSPSQARQPRADRHLRLDLIFVYDVPQGETSEEAWNSRLSTAPNRSPDHYYARPGAAPHQRHHRPHRRGPAVRGRHAPASSGTRRDRLQHRRLPPLSARERLDLEQCR